MQTKPNFPANIKLISTRRHIKGGASTGNYMNFNLATHVNDHQNAVKANRHLLKKQFNLPGEPKYLEQVHSNICLDVSSNECVGDALISRDKGKVCAVLTADCLPIFASSQSGTQVGVAHAGWKGILNGVIESFISQFNSNDLLIHFGPAISQDYFAVDINVYQQFIDKDRHFAKAFKRQNDNYQLNMYQVAKIILNDSGIYLITGGNECTFAQPQDYFSYRRDGENSGRMAHLIWIE